MCAAAKLVQMLPTWECHDQLVFVLLQAPILTVLKRHGDILELVLSSLQVTMGLALLFGVALPSRSSLSADHDTFAAYHATWSSLAQDNSMA